MFHRRMHPDPFARLRTLLAAEPDLEFAVLVGSRAAGMHTSASDWDIALQWRRDLDWMEQLGRTETLRRLLAEALAVPEAAVDLVDAPRANLAMRAAIAEEGVVRAGASLTPLEQNGLLHAVQVLVENAIGKAKQQLKVRGETVPVSAYDAFAALARVGCIPTDSLPAWNAVIGLRNRIVHDYMNVDMEKIFAFLRAHGERPVLDFLLAPLPHEPGVR